MVAVASEGLLRVDGHGGCRSGNECEGDDDKAKDFSHASTSTMSEQL